MKLDDDLRLRLLFNQCCPNLNSGNFKFVLQVTYQLYLQLNFGCLYGSPVAGFTVHGNAFESFADFNKGKRV
jgi:hypothetical protein